MSEFVKGLELCESYFQNTIQSLLSVRFPHLLYSAARLNQGSDVLGFDTPRSMDHDWGPRVQLFLRDEDLSKQKEGIDAVLGQELPFEFQGFSTGFGIHKDGTRYLDKENRRPIKHGVEISSVSIFLTDYLGFDLKRPLREKDWLLIPQQHLRTIRSGKVFHDGLGSVQKIQESLRWYPQDVWIYLLASQWRRIDQEVAFMARCGDVGDELGSKIIAVRLLHEIMRLCFLTEKQYAPYSKWFGSAFAELEAAETLTVVFDAVLKSETWKEREANLSQVYRIVIERHNELQLTKHIGTEMAPFYHRPYLVPNSAKMVEDLLASIESEEVKTWPKYLGSVDQFVDSTDVLDSVNRCQALNSIYEPK